MPKQALTDLPNNGRPSALEMFTDRVDEREVLARCLAPHDEQSSPKLDDFITVFYGVGGVGKSTLCRWAIEESMRSQQGGLLVMLDLDSSRWNPTSAFGHLLAALVPELAKAGVQTPLTQALLLMYAQADSGDHIAQGASGAWNLAVGLVDQATQAAGIPGVSLLLQGAQWLRDRKRQGEVRMRLQQMGLWPEDLSSGSINLLDLEGKLALALYNDLKDWAVAGRNLRILLDGFERIQSRERRFDCQKLLQDFAGFIASSEARHLSGRVRFVLFGRDKLRWEELYDDPDWVGNWNQHLLEGLGEQDALDFIQKRSDWLEDRGDSQVAVALKSHADAILDASDEGGGEDRRIYPYYLDMAVDMICDSIRRGRGPDLGRTPGELQDRFFRYLSSGELHLLKVLAIAESFDAPLFDDLVRANRVSGFAVGSFLSSVVEGRSYILAAPDGSFHFHRLMENALQDLWIKSDVERSQAKEVSDWLLDRIELSLTRIDRKNWGSLEIESWRRGLKIVVTQAYERGLIDLEEASERLGRNVWRLEFPIPMELLLEFHERILVCLERRLGADHSDALDIANKIGNILFRKGSYREAELFYRKALDGREKILGMEDPKTLASMNNMGRILAAKGNFDGAEAIFREALRGREKALGLDHPDTLKSVNNLGILLHTRGYYNEAETLFHRALVGKEKDLGPDHRATLLSVNSLGNLLQAKGNLDGAEALYRCVLEARQKALGSDHPDTLLSVNNLGNLLRAKGDYDGAEALFHRALEGRERALGADHPYTLTSVNSLGNLLRAKGDYDGAGALFHRALEGRERALGADHPYTLTSVNNLGNLLRAKGDYDGAEPLFRRALEGRESVLGTDHPSTLTSLNSLGNLLRAKGDYEGAEASYRRALEGMEKALGPGHPDTLSSVNNLGNLFRAKGDYEGAEMLLRRASEGRKKALGPDHPYTLRSVNSLGDLLNRLKRRTDAIDLLRHFAALSDAAQDTVAYNLSCYECLEGNWDEAQRLIAAHLKLHPEKKGQALADPDFAPIQDFIANL
jgi:tetratricopeptide (TPR) repeat protein